MNRGKVLEVVSSHIFETICIQHAICLLLKFVVCRIAWNGKKNFGKNLTNELLSIYYIKNILFKIT
jgi:hypothetical protein